MEALAELRHCLGDNSCLVADLLRLVAPTLAYQRDEAWLVDLAEYFDDQEPGIAEAVDAFVRQCWAGRVACS